MGIYTIAHGSISLSGMERFASCRAVLTAFLMAMSLAGTAIAEPLEDADAAYRHGDYPAALRRYRPLAIQGSAGARAVLGFMYAQGQGVPQDYAEAVKWFRRAADQGSAKAQNNLGGMYATGRGVEQDYVEAYKWFDLAAANFSATEAEFRTAAVRSRDFVAAKITPAQIAEAQKLARERKPK
jgi:uncharacterized protein